MVHCMSLDAALTILCRSEDVTCPISVGIRDNCLKQSPALDIRTVEISVNIHAHHAESVVAVEVVAKSTKTVTHSA